jgi:hypothetical protein
MVLSGTVTTTAIAATSNGGPELVGEGGARKEKPSKNVNSEMAQPFPGDWTIPTGTWIDHDFNIVGSREGIESAIPTLRVWIGGEEIDNPQQYLADIEETDSGASVNWNYVTPPKSPGTYKFKSSILGPNGPTVKEDYHIVNNQSTR